MNAVIVPIVLGVTALYGYYRYNKSKDQSALDAALTSKTTAPAAPPPPGFAPSPPKMAATGQLGLNLASLKAAGLGAKLSETIYGKGATTADIPSGRIPSSMYGATGPKPAAPPPPASPGAPASGFSAGVSTGFSTGATLKFP